MKKKKEQVLHDVYIDTEDLKEQDRNNRPEYQSFQLFRPRLVEVLDAARDLPLSKGLYACFNPACYQSRKQIPEIEERINDMRGVDLLWCKEPKRRFFKGTYSSAGIGVSVKFSDNSAALELFDTFSNRAPCGSPEPFDTLRRVHWIEYAILDNKWCDRLIETYPGNKILSFISLEELMRESDYFIYALFYDVTSDIDEGLDDYCDVIAYGAEAPAALRRLVNTWGIPSSYQRPGSPHGS